MLRSILCILQCALNENGWRIGKQGSLIPYLWVLQEDWDCIGSVLCEFTKSVLLELKGRNAMFDRAWLCVQLQ